MAKIVGIVNVTPDSFSDGGQFLDPGAAISHGERLIAEGADVLDIGGESTRPGAGGVSAEEELDRVLPVLEGLAGAGVTLSIDTSKAAVAAAAIDAGATIVNDVTALGDPELAPLCADRDVELVLMHMQGTPRTMQENPVYDEVVTDVRAFLAHRVERAVAAGLSEQRIWIDPGIGFGKTLEHNLELIRRLGELRSLGRPILVGVSRKSSIGAITGRDVDDRLGGSLAAGLLALEAGADALRVHDVAATRDAIVVADTVAGRRKWRIEE